MNKSKLATPDQLRNALRYEAQTGMLFWKQSGSGRGNIELPAGCIHLPTGYRRIYFLGKNHQAHRVIWAIKTGEWPKVSIDHRNKKRDDNRWFNLRLATASQNSANKTSRKGSSSKFLGVSWHKKHELWQANICVNGRSKYLGMFESEESAAHAYDDAAIKHRGDFASVNFERN